MDKIDCKIIVCGPAIGKTYLAEHDKRFIDLDGEKAKYKYGLYNITLKELEKGKLNRGEIVNHDSSAYIIKKLNDYITDNLCVLLSYNSHVIDYIHQNNLPYCLVYAGKDASQEYKQRMISRGNSELFIEQMTNISAWNKFYEENKNDTKPKYKIELKQGEYLSDIAELFF